jgi:hypothetical protein
VFFFEVGTECLNSIKRGFGLKGLKLKKGDMNVKMYSIF